MNVDKKTSLRYLNITIEDKKEVLEKAKEIATGNELAGKDCETQNLQFTNDEFELSPEEYYFEDGEINLTGYGTSKGGDLTYSLVMPLSDEVLIDILSYAMKKYNKLKSVIESLK